MGERAIDEIKASILARPGDFITLEDGYVYFWPARDSLGAISAAELRVIADLLDEKNKPWDEEVRTYLEQTGLAGGPT